MASCEIGAIHTYVELYARMFVDLTPNVALVCAEKADAPATSTPDPTPRTRPTIVEAAAFRDGIVLAQVNEIVDELPRVDIPGSWVDLIVAADRPFALEPLFTRDPRHINELQVLMGMMVIRGIYERHGVTSLNHGIGFDTAAIELLLPTYGESLGLQAARSAALGAQSASDADPGDRERLGRERALLRRRGGHGGLHRARAPTSFSPARTAACAPTACCVSWPASTASTCSSARRCRWTRTPTPPPSRSAGSPASAARLTWATIRTAAGTAARRG